MGTALAPFEAQTVESSSVAAEAKVPGGMDATRSLVSLLSLLRMIWMPLRERAARYHIDIQMTWCHKHSILNVVLPSFFNIRCVNIAKKSTDWISHGMVSDHAFTSLL